ncbi:hypothetical protein C0991_006865 [Blastosporella zonata]|nr:hypothetical protein C0991_006865 [Blastosporella zonata]
MNTQVIVSKPHPVPVMETYREKASRKFKENPWVPLGALATVGALVTATVKMRRGQSQSFNKWLRVRVAAQGLTIVAVCIGTWGFRPQGPFSSSSSPSTSVDTSDPTLTRNDVDVERRRLEKMAREKDEFEERLRGAEQAHEAETGLRATRGRKEGPGSVKEVGDASVSNGGWSAWLPWSRSNSKPTTPTVSSGEDPKPKS